MSERSSAVMPATGRRRAPGDGDGVAAARRMAVGVAPARRRAPAPGAWTTTGVPCAVALPSAALRAIGAATLQPWRSPRSTRRRGLPSASVVPLDGEDGLDRACGRVGAPARRRSRRAGGLACRARRRTRGRPARATLRQSWAWTSTTPSGPVAAGFAARQAAWEAERLVARRRAVLPGAPARARGGLRRCARRFQRDRDRIVHSKAFRRLKHKTQVFVAPGGRPLPHAADPHARGHADRAHRRAGAAPQRGPRRGDRARARPRPPAVRPHRRGGARPRACASASGRGFRHYEHSLRVVDVLERDGAGLNLTDDVRDGILCHSGARRAPATLEGRIVRLVDRVAYINHDIDDAVRAGRAARGRAARPSRSRCSATRARGASTRSCTTSSSTPTSPATSSRAREAGAAMDALRTFMFERVYLGPGRAARAREDRARRARRCSTTTPRTPRGCPTAAARRGPTWRSA